MNMAIIDRVIPHEPFIQRRRVAARGNESGDVKSRDIEKAERGNEIVPFDSVLTHDFIEITTNINPPSWRRPLPGGPPSRQDG
jgi:hypothetical protein